MQGDPQSGVAFQIEPLPPLADLEIAWREAETRYNRSVFTGWCWIGAWLRTLPCDVQPQLIRAARANETVGLAIGVLRRARRNVFVVTTQLHFNASGKTDLDSIAIEHNDFVGAAGLLPAFVEWFGASASADELVIAGTALRNAQNARGLLRAVHAVPAFANDQLAAVGRRGLGAMLSRNARQQLNRSMRALSRLGPLRVEAAATPAESLAWFAALKILHARSWTRRGKRHAFTSSYFEIFHGALLTSGAGEMLRLSAGDRVFGYLYNLRRGNVVYAYQSGFADEFGAERPGYISHALAMEHYAKHGVAEYDFLAGENRLKRSFGPRRYCLCWVRFSRPTAPLRVEATLRALRDRLRGTRIAPIADHGGV